MKQARIFLQVILLKLDLEQFPHITLEQLAANAYVDPVPDQFLFIGLENEDTGAHFYTASEAEKQFLEDFPQYMPEGNNGIAYYVDPGDPFPDFFAPPLVRPLQV